MRQPPKRHLSSLREQFHSSLFHTRLWGLVLFQVPSASANYSFVFSFLSLLDFLWLWSVPETGMAETKVKSTHFPPQKPQKTPREILCQLNSPSRFLMEMIFSTTGRAVQPKGRGVIGLLIFNTSWEWCIKETVKQNPRADEINPPLENTLTTAEEAHTDSFSLNN